MDLILVKQLILRSRDFRNSLTSGGENTAWPSQFSHNDILSPVWVILTGLNSFCIYFYFAFDQKRY
jgi:hypothetical protein